MNKIVAFWQWLKADLWTTVRVYLPAIVVAVVGTIVLLTPHLQEKLASLTLVVLSAFAFLIGLDRLKLIQLTKLLRPLAHNATSIRVFKTWHDQWIFDQISSARKSIVIVDSCFDEPTMLSILVDRALEHGVERLDVSIYMLDPDEPFGAQRLLEIGGRWGGLDAAELGAKYKEMFQVCVDSIRTNLSNFLTVKLKIYKFTTMPAMRLFIVDDIKFIFSWFPANAVAPANVCFFLSAGSPLGADCEAVQCLQKQLEEIQNVSRLVSWD